MDRRRFLKSGIGAILGMAVGATWIPVGSAITDVVQQTTGRPVTNKGLEEFMDKYCQDKPNPQACVEHLDLPYELEIYTTVVGPILEEAIFRAAPSALLSFVNSEDILETLSSGTRKPRMTKRELLLGTATSLLFGLGHNFTTKGDLDSQTIPATSTLIGLSLWYLQRKFGFLANTLSHITTNSLAVALIRNK